MTANNYVLLNNKKYKVYAEGYQPAYDRLRVHTLGLTRKTIIQDFGAAPQEWNFKLKVYINTPPDNTWGTWSDLMTAFSTLGVNFTDYDTSLTYDEETDSYTVTGDGAITYSVLVDGPLLRIPHVAANIAGYCNGVFDVNVKLTEILS